MMRHAVDGYLTLIRSRPKLVLVVALGLAVGGASLWERIAINPNLDALLSEDSESRAAAELARSRVASTSPLYLLVQSPDPALNRRLAATIAARVQAWPDVRWVMTQRDPRYFLDRQLLYLPASEVAAVADELARVVEYHECEAMPGCVNLEDEPPQPDLRRLEDVYAHTPAVRSLASLFGEEPPQLGVRADEKLGELCSADGGVCAVVAVLNGDPGDLTYAVDVLGRAERLLESVRPDAATELRLVVSGRFRNAPLAKRAVARDLKNTAGLSLLLVVVVLSLRFRGARPMLVLLCPIVVGMAWTVGVVALVEPELNVISAFTLAILAGLGVDFGVHFLTHYGSLADDSPEDAVSRTTTTVGSSMLVAALTTTCGFLALAASSFEGFAQLGRVAALGIALTFVATFVVVPPLLVLGVARLPVLRRAPLLVMARPIARRPAIAVVVVGMILAGIGGLMGQGLQLETNMRNIGPQSTGHGIAWSGAMHGTNRTAVVLLAEDAELLEAAARDVRATTIDGVSGAASFVAITPQTFIPPDQGPRLEAIGRLRGILEDAKGHANAELLDDIDRWSPLLEVREPIAAERLPRWVRDAFSERDGRLGGLGVAYTTLSGADARDMEQLSIAMSQWRRDHPHVVFASAVALLGEVLPGLEQDAPIMLGLALLGLALATLTIGRSWRRTLLALAPLTVALAISLGVMAALDLRINLYNMLVFPLAFGIGVDGAIYLSWNARDSHGRLDARAIRTSASAVLVSTMTTMAAFGSLMIASDRGLQSLGLVAVITLASTLLANMVWLVALMSASARA